MRGCVLYNILYNLHLSHVKYQYRNMKMIYRRKHAEHQPENPELSR